MPLPSERYSQSGETEMKRDNHHSKTVFTNILTNIFLSTSFILSFKMNTQEGKRTPWIPIRSSVSFGCYQTSPLSTKKNLHFYFIHEARRSRSHFFCKDWWQVRGWVVSARMILNFFFFKEGIREVKAELTDSKQKSNMLQREKTI